MDPMQILATLGDRGLAGAAGAVVFYSWFTTWLAGGGTFYLVASIIWNFFIIFATLVAGGACFLVGMWLYSLASTGGPASWENFLSVKDPKFSQEYQGKKIPMETMIEAYLEEKIDFRGDVYETLKNHRYDIFRMCFTLNHLPFILKRFVPMVLSHTIEIDKREVREVYDRGNDFYGWFLGPSMLYTSGVFESEDDTLEQAQENKMRIACKKIHLKEGERLLDIGCGWGTFACFAAERFKANVVGVTISREGEKFASDQAQRKNVSDKVKFLCRDYREIPNDKFDKITCFEMAEHVGVKNFQLFLSIVNDRLKDDGIFYLQIAGLRRHWQFEDLIWGLFMNKYIFPGADASCPLGWYVSQLETAGFEIRSIETIGIHYSLTIKRWYDNWMNNKAEVQKGYGEFWYRLWSIFLAWACLAAGQGSATCYQIVLNKNTSSFDRKIFVGKRYLDN